MCSNNKNAVNSYDQSDKENKDPNSSYHQRNSDNQDSSHGSNSNKLDKNGQKQFKYNQAPYDNVKKDIGVEGYSKLAEKDISKSYRDNKIVNKPDVAASRSRSPFGTNNNSSKSPPPSHGYLTTNNKSSIYGQKNSALNSNNISNISANNVYTHNDKGLSSRRTSSINEVSYLERLSKQKPELSNNMSHINNS